MISCQEKRISERDEFLRLLWRDSFTEAPKRSKHYQAETSNVVPLTRYDHGYTYLGYYRPEDPDLKNIPVRTFQTLFAAVDAENIIYCKPNTYWRSDGMQEDNLRFLNAFVVDIDDLDSKYMDCAEDYILHTCKQNGLPAPTLINRTPSGGYHVWFLFDKKMPIPGKKSTGIAGNEYSKVVLLYNTIHRRMIEVLGGDSYCTGAAQFYRIPRNIGFYDPNNLSSFSSYVKWLHELYPENDPKSDEYFLKKIKPLPIRGNLMQTRAAKELLKGFSAGNRNEGLYALACLLRSDGVNVEEGKKIVLGANVLCNPPLPEREVLRSVASAYRGNKIPAKVIENITGHKVLLYKRTFVKHKKNRKERTRSHTHEWVGDIFVKLKKQKGRIEGTQKKIAKMLKIPLSTFKKILKKLKGDNSAPFQINSERGCNGTTEIFIRNITHKPQGVKQTSGSRIKTKRTRRESPAAVGFSARFRSAQKSCGREGPP